MNIEINQESDHFILPTSFGNDRRRLQAELEICRGLLAASWLEWQDCQDHFQRAEKVSINLTDVSVHV